MNLRLIRCLAFALVLLPISSQSDTLIAANAKSKPKESVDATVDQIFFDDGEPPPSQDPDFQYNEKPGDSGIEYAEPEYASPEDPADQQKPLNQSSESIKKNSEKKPRPPSDEPPPLVRRDREVIDLPSAKPQRWIRHPMAEKGLTKITKDKVYVYRVQKSPQTAAASLRFGTFDPQDLKNGNGETFSTYYSNGNSPIIMFDYEWQWSKRFGRLGPKAGVGMAFASGTGRFKDTNRTGSLAPKEAFSFLTLPATAGLIYRFQFWERQILVPYAEGGGVGFPFLEYRDDGSAPKSGISWGAYGAAGVAFNMNFLDTISMLELDREYGINNFYLVAEYRYMASFGTFNFSSGVINAGILADF